MRPGHDTQRVRFSRRHVVPFRTSARRTGNAWRPSGPGRLGKALGRAGRELALVTVLFALYKAGRTAISDQEIVAIGHAETVYRLQEALRLPAEAALQSTFEVDWVLRVANLYYTSVHFPLMAVFLLVGWTLRPRAQYQWARNLLVIQTSAALVIHIMFPLAPPRMFPEWGFTDTMATIGPSPYDGASAEVANQFAAMPSLHVGWAVAIAYVVARTGPRALAVVAALHAVLTTVVVVVTANHWWLDAVAGVLLLVVADRIMRSRIPTRVNGRPMTAPNLSSQQEIP